jgi:phosphate/phosphite/phosphonate ABC transporter binding protein
LGKILNKNIVDFAVISPTAYVKSKMKFPGIKYVATVISKKTKQPYYHGVIFTRSNSNVKTYRDLKNKLFAFVEKSSGSGYVFPVARMIIEWNIDPKTYFKTTLFMGNHHNVIKAVMSGQAHAGATWEKPFEYAVKKYSKKAIRVLMKSPPIPLDAFTVKPNTSKKMINKLRKILLSINKNTRTKTGEYVIKNYYYMGFTVKNNEFYDIIRQTLKTVKNWQNKWKSK